LPLVVDVGFFPRSPMFEEQRFSYASREQKRNRVKCSIDWTKAQVIMNSFS
jgi:hypothetical protein